MVSLGFAALPVCHCEPRPVGAWQSPCEAGSFYNWIEKPRLEIASSLSLLAMTKKEVVLKSWYMVKYKRGWWLIVASTYPLE
jgi:hypothetical protein